MFVLSDYTSVCMHEYLCSHLVIYDSFPLFDGEGTFWWIESRIEE